MSEKEVFILSDKNVVPTDDYIFSLLGDKKELWNSIMKHVKDNYKDTSGTWNYYNDGKQWLFKMVRKKKTIFWSAMLQDAFRISFYFGDKAIPLIDASELPPEIKAGFKTAKKYGAIRPISIKVLVHSDVETILQLIEIKNKI